ncbi:DUF952 domain-containing protein [Couchioplanes azureus]|uniref:DUF952 domain-containing protein n=1 Tax=Couchioplanes caeruleus TaxID=56438 RepID=UPI001E344888|nr:DUF952 domain-containing protein [Couchioplanes caeruleus]
MRGQRHPSIIEPPVRDVRALGAYLDGEHGVPLMSMPAVCQHSAVPIYKILLPSEWAQFRSSGRFDGSPFDRTSGYLHLSTRAQVVSTATRRFADEESLVVLAIDARAYGDQLRWEMMPNGGPYPHLYGSLTLGAVVAVHQVPGAAAVEATLTRAEAST